MARTRSTHPASWSFPAVGLGPPAPHRLLVLLYHAVQLLLDVLVESRYLVGREYRLDLVPRPRPERLRAVLGPRVERAPVYQVGHEELGPHVLEGVPLREEVLPRADL